MSSAALKEPFLRVVQSTVYKSPDQIAFEEAVSRRDDGHSWLSNQRLGYFNVVGLHMALITNDAGAQPYLVSNFMTKLQLTAFEPDVDDVKATLSDNAFYNALLNVAKSRKTPLPAAYREAIVQDKGYGAILRQELNDRHLTR